MYLSRLHALVQKILEVERNMQNYILVYKTRLLAQIIANHTEDNKSISPAGRQRNISSAQLLLAVRT